MSVAEKCACCGIIFQSTAKHLFLPTVTDELAFAMENLCIERNEMIRRIDKVLFDLDIEHLRHRKINTLSGGEKQSVAIASVLTMQPKVLICDEITASLDEEKRGRIISTLNEFRNEGGVVVLVSHGEVTEANKVLELGVMS
jgi:energy-coupling factor transporter ATP-binding protein EcfA2